MANTGRRAWKLDEFTAHSSNVNCLALGHKSGRVLVTGGDDRKVNLWAVGKPSCIMSLTGHTTPVEAVQFSPTEEFVCAGSAAGAVKVWDLEAARMVRTLTGHRGGIRTVDFHPYGDFLATGSLDTNIKLWDIRRKGCIFTYKGHSLTVNSLRFSPDGQWVVSAGEDGIVKIWDLRAGRLLSELREHTASVTDVQFHPHEFLLASGGADRRVLFWDLETFQLVSASEPDAAAPVRCIYFHTDGACLFSGAHDGLRIYGWEPCRIHDVLPLNWGKVHDLAMTSSQLIGVSHNMSTVSVYVVDLKKVRPLGIPPCASDVPGLSFRHGQPLRKSFNKDKPTNGAKSELKMKMTEESDEKSSTETEDDALSTADIKDINNYQTIFKPRHQELPRTPPPPEDIGETGDDAQIMAELNPPVISADPVVLPVIRPPPPDLVQQHSSLLAGPVKAAAQTHRPSPSPSPPTGPPINGKPSYKTQGGPGRPAATSLRERRNSTSSVSASVASRVTASVSMTGLNLERDGAGLAAPHTPSSDSPRPDVTNFATPLPPQIPPTARGRTTHRQHVPRKESIKDILQPSLSDPENPPRPSNIRHSPSEPVLHQRSLSQSRSSSLSRHAPSLRPDIAAPTLPRPSQMMGVPADATPSPLLAAKHHFVPMIPDKLAGLDLHDFLPRKMSSLSMGVAPVSSAFNPTLIGSPEQNDTEVWAEVSQGHQSMMTVLSNRHRNLQVVYNLWQNKDSKIAVETAVGMNDPAVIVDMLSVIIFRPFLWNLDLCVLLLPAIGDLIQSKFEAYVNVACNALRLILKNFAPIIKTNIEAPVHSVGVDISREERYNKSFSCYSQLVPIKAFVLKRQAMSGKLGQTFRELQILLQIFD